MTSRESHLCVLISCDFLINFLFYHFPFCLTTRALLPGEFAAPFLFLWFLVVPFSLSFFGSPSADLHVPRASPGLHRKNKRVKKAYPERKKKLLIQLLFLCPKS